MSDNPPPAPRDLRNQRIVVISLGATVLVTAIAISILAAMGMEVPSSLPAFGSTALGALTGMLAWEMNRRNGNGG